jgi:hypothetical protein
VVSPIALSNVVESLRTGSVVTGLFQTLSAGKRVHAPEAGVGAMVGVAVGRGVGVGVGRGVAVGVGLGVAVAVGLGLGVFLGRPSTSVGAVARPSKRALRTTVTTNATRVRIRARSWGVDEVSIGLTDGRWS